MSIDTAKLWIDVTAAEVRAAIMTILGVVVTAVTAVAAWAVRIDRRVSTLEQKATRDAEDHRDINAKLDRLIDHLIEHRK